MNGSGVFLACQRRDCGTTEIVQVQIERGGIPEFLGDAIDEVLQEVWEDGWGWDVNGADQVLHCPEHRT